MFKKYREIKMCKVWWKTANPEKAVECVDEFAKLVADEHFSREQVYNVYETALYWWCTLPVEDKRIQAI